mmetsp:Transcript_21390/g.36651  ORF Transcript_21390/g.36651 Transcript_21390/m.36651 type:complete len:95 (-) Transcript_21390:2495-2779(-)
MNRSGDNVQNCLTTRRLAVLKLRSIQSSAKKGKEVAIRKSSSSHESQTDNALASVSATGISTQVWKTSKKLSQSDKSTTSQTYMRPGKLQEMKN